MGDMASQKVVRFVEYGKKILAVGRNYKEHAKELGNPIPEKPLLFLKPTSSYITAGQAVKIPSDLNELHHEVELGVIIGKNGANISESEAMNYVGGYTLALDMTDRIGQLELKKKGHPWTWAKGFDTSCPVSDFIPTEKVGDLNNLNLWLKVNGEMKQNGNTSDMIFSVPFLISYVSKRFRLEEGDLLLTGTPAGVSAVKAGDVIEAGMNDVMKIEFKVES